MTRFYILRSKLSNFSLFRLFTELIFSLSIFMTVFRMPSPNFQISLLFGLFTELIFNRKNRCYKKIGSIMKESTLIDSQKHRFCCGFTDVDSLWGSNSFGLVFHRWIDYEIEISRRPIDNNNFSILRASILGNAIGTRKMYDDVLRILLQVFKIRQAGVPVPNTWMWKNNRTDSNSTFHFISFVRRLY